ncbi:hypothetical protein QQM79_02225 [Marinobacteraceae bacterium S3BR75-40.1]
MMGQADTFHAVARHVYRDDPRWLGEDPQALARQFAALEDDPAHRAWFDTHNDQARLAVFYHPNQVIDGQPTAFFGFWEGEDDLAAHATLFRAAEQWARDQGATRLLGPINISTFNAYRVRLNHFEDGPFPGEPYNPPYYPRLLDELDLKPVKHFHSWLGPMDGRAESMGRSLEPVYQSLLAEGLRFSPLDGATWLGRLDEFYRYVDQIFGNNYAYTGISETAFRQGFGQPIASRLCPRSSVLVETADGDVAGFFLGFPDYGPLACQGNPKRKALADCTFDDLARIPGRKTLLGKTGGVHPAYRQKGLFGVMSYRMMQAGTGQYDWGGAVMVREDNPSARVGQLAYSRPDDEQHDYALYGKEL